ncbi:MAG: hypothetical protein K2M36_00075, partial [Clostridia bacterium]|nr:hypothetical protein [Clostridia bacterium]
MSYFIVLIFMLLLGVDLAYLFKRGFGRTAALANCILIFMLYLGGLFADLRIAMYVFLACVILLTAYTGFKVIRARDISGIAAVIKNPTFYLYAVLGVALGIVFLQFTPLACDEMTQWALVVKNMFAYGNFGNIGNTTTMFNQYVPGTGVFLYAFQIFGREFSTGALFAASDLLLISFLLPVMELFKKKLSIPCVLTFVCAILAVVFFKPYVFNNILVDILLAVLAGYIYLVYRLDKNKIDGFTVANIALGCFVISAVKSTGFILSIFALIFIAIDMLTVGRSSAKEFFADKRNTVYALLPVVLIAFVKLSWSWYIDFYNVRAGWDSSEINFSNIMAWISHPTPFQTEVTNKFLLTFFLGALYEGDGLQIPQVLGFALIAVACYFLWRKTKNKAFVISQGIYTAVMVVGYGFSMLLMYLFSFSYIEGLELASYCRYLSSVMLTAVLVYLYQFADLYAVEWSEKDILPARVSAKVKPYAYPIYAALVGIISLGIAIGGYFTTLNETKREDAPYLMWDSAVSTLNASDSVYI